MRNDLSFNPIFINATDHTDAWKQFMLNAMKYGRNMSGKKVSPGPSLVFCKDLHLYGHQVEAAKAWIG